MSLYSLKSDATEIALVELKAMPKLNLASVDTSSIFVSHAVKGSCSVMSWTWCSSLAVFAEATTSKFKLRKAFGLGGRNSMNNDANLDYSGTREKMDWPLYQNKEQMKRKKIALPDLTSKNTPPYQDNRNSVRKVASRLRYQSTFQCSVSWIIPSQWCWLVVQWWCQIYVCF